MVDVLARTFAANDPPAVALGLTEADFQDALRVTATCVRQRLSVVARETVTGVMAGAMLAEDAMTPERDASATPSPFAPMIELLSQLERPDSPPHAPGQSVHILFLGVATEFGGRGVAQGPVEAGVANASARGYIHASTEASNRVSQRVFANLGFTTTAQVSYGDFRRDGEAPFASIADVGGPMKMVRDLSPGARQAETGGSTS